MSHLRVLGIGVAVLGTVQSNSLCAEEPLSKQCELTVQVISAMENGPLVLKASLAYHGTRRLEVSYQTETDLTIDVPRDWGTKDRVESGTSQGPRLVHRELIPDVGFRHFFQLHWKYGLIPAGDYDLVIRWTIREPKNGTTQRLPKVMGRFEKRVAVSIPRRSERSVQSLSRSLTTVAEAAKTEDSLAGVALSILDSDVAEFAQLATQLAGKPSPYTESLMAWVFKALPKEMATAQALEGALNARPGEAAVWLSVWHTNSHRCPPTKEQLERMVGSANIWTRLATFIFFPEAFSSAQARELMVEATKVKTPLSADQLTPLIQQLDERSYHRRENAAQRLIAYGDRAVPVLRSAAANTTSAEVLSRIASVMEGIKAHSPDAAEAQFAVKVRSLLPHFPNAERVLEALAKNDPEARVARQAKSALAEFYLEQSKTPSSKK